MTVYHINSKGEKAVCHARRRLCRFGAAAHTTESAAQPTNLSEAYAANIEADERQYRSVHRDNSSAEQNLAENDVEEIIKSRFNGWNNFSSEDDATGVAPVYYKDEKHELAYVKSIKDGKNGRVQVVFTIDGQLWRKEGYLSSYDGNDFEYGNLSRVKEINVESDKYTSNDKDFDPNPPIKNAIESGMGWKNLSYASPGEQYRFEDKGETYDVEIVEEFKAPSSGGTTALIFSVNGELWRKEGYYSSYDGHDYSFGLLERVKKQETYDTEYEDI